MITIQFEFISLARECKKERKRDWEKILEKILIANQSVESSLHFLIFVHQ